MQFAQFVEWAFYGVVGSCAVYIAKSIHELNIQVAVLITKYDTHSDDIKDLKQRVHDLEVK